MEMNGRQITVWSERFKDDWRYHPGETHRHERGTFDLDGLTDLLERIRDLNGKDLDGLLILQRGEKILGIEISQSGLYVFNPRDPATESVSVAHTEARSFLEEQLERSASAQIQEAPKPGKERYLIFAGLTAAFMAALYLLVLDLGQDKGFLPVAEVDEIINEAESEKLVYRFHGVYTTAMEDGGMLLELQEDGDFLYCDIHQDSPGHFWAKSVVSGNYRPVREEGRLAFLTDSRFLLYPEETTISFQGRTYTLLGKARADVPYLSFNQP